MFYGKNILGNLYRVVSCVLALGSCNNDVRKVPKNLLLGAATSAYQVEGAWNISRSESIWDRTLHVIDPCLNTDCSNGDEATNSYYNNARNIEMIKELGLDFYRFSIAWPRVLPYGFANYTNPEGIAYYNTLIDTLLENNITPVVTIYHWDMPQVLQDLGGFENSLIVDWLGDFARVCYENFGDRVKHWVTINEPKEICSNGYGEGTFAPQIDLSGISDYICTKNLLVAHANMYHIYDREFRATQKGTVGFTIHTRWYVPASDSKDDIEAAEDFFTFELGLYANPIYSKEGNWPRRIIERVKKNSKKEGFPRSRLPKFTPQEIDFIRGSYDFFGLNYYTGFMVYRNSSLEGYYPAPSYSNDIYAVRFQPAEWKGNASSWVYSVPWGLTKVLQRIREDYNNPEVFITENGYTIIKELNQTDITDKDRVSYLRDHLVGVLDAIDEGSKVTGYTHWSLMDNFEWKGGFRSPFGLYEVDRTTDAYVRSPRLSAYVYKNIISTRTIDYSYTPDMSVAIAEAP